MRSSDMWEIQQARAIVTTARSHFPFVRGSIRSLLFLASISYHADTRCIPDPLLESLQHLQYSLSHAMPMGREAGSLTESSALLT